MHPRTFAAIFALGGLLTWAETLLAADTENGYRFVDLGTLGGPDSRANGIASNGWILGHSKPTTGESRAFVCFPPYNDLQSLPPLLQYEPYLHTAHSANSSGVIVGLTQAENLGQRAVMWINLQPSELPPLPGYGDTEALDINDSAVVVGACWRGPRTLAAVRWTGTVPEELATLANGDQNAARSINAAGAIVGESDNAAGFMRAVIWDGDGSVTDLGVLPGDERSSAQDLNDLGDIVGWSRGPGGDRAVLWRNGTILDLSPMTTARAVNNYGVVVGAVAKFDTIYGRRYAPALWNNARLTELPIPAGQWGFDFALSINDDGLIVGEVRGHAVLWMPIPVTTQERSLSDVKSLYRR